MFTDAQVAPGVARLNSPAGRRKIAGAVGLLAIAALALSGDRAHAAGPPAFPQRFEVRGPELASFGFAVTQPGPIVVDVRWQGPPLRVSLQGANRVENAGAGRIVLNYQVTPQDVQQSVLWSINLSQQNPSGTPVIGEINVQSPPAEPNAAQRAAQAQVQTVAPSAQQIAQLTATGNAQVEQFITMRRSQFAQDIARRDLGERQKLQALTSQRAAAAGAAQQMQQQPAQGEVRSRGLGSDNIRMQPGLRPLPVQVQPAPPPFQITSMNVTTGGPQTSLLINGTGFGTSPGRVLLTLPPGRVIPCTGCAPTTREALPDQAAAATVSIWTDTSIVVQLPDLTGVQSYGAELFVNRNNENSNRVPFAFVARQEMRVIRNIPGDRRFSQTVLSQVLPPTGNQVMHTRIPGIPFSEFAGEKGDDEFFLRTNLQNGWTVSAVRFFPMGQGLGSGGQQMMGNFGGSYVQGTPTNTSLYLNVRWWLNPFGPFSFYNWAIEVTGPAGVPDGVVSL
jgi:hypothetical protein